jgi:glycolate oxidase
MIQKSVLEKLKSIVKADHYLDSEEDKIVYSYDGTPLLSRKPEAILKPQNEEQISSILKLANEENFNIVARGSGTGLSGGSVPVENSVVLLMNHWNKILEIDKENLMAWVEPGVITGKLQQAVEAHQLFYPPDPGSMNICTIGGNVAENAGGLRGLKYGVTKNYISGLEMILANGSFVKSGGKNVKDVAGYNLRDMAIGSEGTIAIFTKILVRLIPKPQKSITMLAFFNQLSSAAQSVAEIISKHIIPCTMEFLDNTTIKSVESYAKIGLDTTAEALLLLEVDGHPAVVEDEAQQMETILKKNNAQHIEVAKDIAEADRLKTARRAAFSALARVKPTTILEDATTPRDMLPELISKTHEYAKKYGLLMGNFGHAGDGNMHPTILTDERDKNELLKVERFFNDVYQKTIELGGTITGEHGVGLAKKEFMENFIQVPAKEMMQNIKKALDPNDILNRGKIFSTKPKCEGKLHRSAPDSSH